MWCESLVLWSLVSYGITADPLKGESAKFRWKLWMWSLSFRAGLIGVLSYATARSVLFSSFLLVITIAQPLLRYRLRMQWLAEFECLSMSASMAISLILIRHLHLSSKWVPAVLTLAQTAAICIVASTLLLVVRGGTYIVRGVLKKAGTLPSTTQYAFTAAEIPPTTSPAPALTPPPPPASLPAPSAAAAPAAPAAAPAGSQSALATSISTSPLRQEAVSGSAVTPRGSQGDVDIEELNRGRLIGNLERIVLTMVVAAGSYAALAFLVAAKGLVRSEEFEKSRDFTEYFLIGSLSSILVALCAGLALRYALLTLWPELLVLQMQQ
jgi:hypothetical protein